MENANNSAHGALTPRRVVAEFSRALWRLRTPFAFLFALYLLLSVVIYYVGGPVDPGSGTPSSFWETLYFCAMRAIAFGYRNIVPTTTIGRIASESLGVLGILVACTVAAAAVRGVNQAVQNAGKRC
ncbi:ion channel [Paraburkholderia sp. EG285A]|uniref:ion channel n=1 Tax=Paraburkholderia sp. EG285A TaxID=3237009 RepID=UPI0034D1DCEF